ncbi:MAG: threonine--tRNA ligase [Candidatus Pacearchaeota archaeon]|nr:threonine--tRNA ligase [Candidatus Pacearchaeota archaeon]
MKILTLHCDYIRFKPVKAAISKPEEIKKEAKLGNEIKECLVVLSAVEKQDEGNEKAIVKNLVSNVKSIAVQVKAKKIVLYPYVHLTNTPSKPDTALFVLREAEKELKELKFSVIRAPFGWYKEFELKCKGHPLSELSREIKTEEIAPGKKEKGEGAAESEALKAEKKLKSEWFILTDTGKLHRLKFGKGKNKDELAGFDFSKHAALEKLARYEMKKIRVVGQEPAHVKYMRKLELVDYESASDPGNLRYYPKGRMVKALIEDYVTKRMHEYGALEVETPIMYDYEHPSLKAYLNRFPARQYSIDTPNKKVFLRFAACFGQFIMASQAVISYKDLPLKLYELTKYSFRVEQRGELVGLKRLRTFTMPDCHALCKDIEQAKQEMALRFILAKDVQQNIGLDFHNLELAIRVTKDFYEKNKEFIVSLVKEFGKPALLEMWPSRFFYFVTKYEFNFIDSLNKAFALNTDQIDVENAERYGIYYVDEHNKRKPVTILHLSPSGAIERVMCSLLEQAYFDEKQGKNPCLPYWLSPTQVRIVPISEKFINEAVALAEDLNDLPCRVDVDDRPLHVEKKVLEAEQEWVPFVVCLGKRELEKKSLNVRIRRMKGKVIEIKMPELKKLLEQEQRSMPWRPLPLPLLLSKRPKFV